jgi:hypothetical protein
MLRFIGGWTADALADVFAARNCHRLQSSPASRFTAGDFGFLTLIQ